VFAEIIDLFLKKYHFDISFVPPLIVQGTSC